MTKLKQKGRGRKNSPSDRWSWDTRRLLLGLEFTPSTSLDSGLPAWTGNYTQSWSFELNLRSNIGSSV